MFPLKLIAHPTDFSLASHVAFAHALKLALAAKAQLRVIHYADQEVDVDWNCFPRVKDTLVRWNILSPQSTEQDLGKLGLGVEGIIARGTDTLESILRHLIQPSPDMLVLATHQIEGFNRWLYRPVAEPLARQVKRPTLFVPPVSEGFVSEESGTITLERILIPITLLPPPQPAIDATVALAELLGVRRIDWTIFHVGSKEEMPALHLPVHEGWKWEKLARSGDPIGQIHEMTRECSPNLIVMATEGPHGLFDMVCGSTTERILREVRCPLLAYPVHPENTT